MKIQFKPIKASPRSYLVVVTGLGTAGIVTPAPDGHWQAASLDRDVRVPGRRKTRQQAAQKLVAAMATRMASRPGRGQ